MATVETLLPWVESLIGLERSRCFDAVSRLRSWHLRHIDEELFSLPDLDTVAAAVLLVESVEALCAQGVQRTKLIKKLRDARAPAQFWPTWAEVRAAAMLVGREDFGATIELEPDAALGRHADFRLIHEDGESVDIEFKAVGLSDAEVAWHREAAKQFNRLLPPVGLSTAHGSLDRPIRVTGEKRQRAFERSQQLAEALRARFPAWADVRGIAIVGHQTEQQYMQRAASRLNAAFTQLNSAQESWLGLWWGNGAPLAGLDRILLMAGAPANIGGVVSLGQAVAVPWSEISIFITSVPRGAGHTFEIDSAVDSTPARRVLERFESSSGIRPTLLRTAGRDSTILLKRDGRRRLFPFNLLFDADPRALSDPHRAPSPVQDVELDA